jgi:septal ring-binding cell division protein DamX
VSDQEDETTDTYAIAKLNFDSGNYPLAFQEVKAPAEDGDPNAQYALGYMYYYGKGTQQDITLGKYWIQKAADNHNETAINAYQSILSAEQSQLINPKPVTTQENIPTIPSRVLPAPKASMVKYTLQLIDEESKESAQNFIKGFGLSQKESRIVSRQMNGKTLYSVVYGHYASEAEAKRALEKLPKGLQDLHPFVRALP